MGESESAGVGSWHDCAGRGDRLSVLGHLRRGCGAARSSMCLLSSQLICLSCLPADVGLRVCGAGSGSAVMTAAASALGGAVLRLMQLVSARRISGANVTGSTRWASSDEAQFPAAIGNF